jgi:integrase
VRGHFKKRGQTWYFWAELERGSDGLRRQKSAGGFRTRKDAERAFAALRDEVRLGHYVESSKATLGQFLTDEWLPGIRASVRPTTLDHYQRIVEAHVLPRLGALPLQRVTPAKLNAFYADVLAGGRRDGRGDLSPKTVRHVHTTLHKALSDAVRWGRLPRNPADHAEPPKPRTAEMKVWSAEQLRVFLEQVESDRLHAAWLLMATTGMRRGEVLGLRWVDVNLEVGRLSVVQTLALVRERLIFGEPKTAKGRRSVALDRVTVAALRSHRALQLEERLAWGEAWQDTGLVFTREDGSPIHPSRFTEAFQRHAARARLPRIRLHDVRHSYATAALTARIPAKVVSERLGHANVSITLDTYSHVLPSLEEEAASVVARLILGGRADGTSCSLGTAALRNEEVDDLVDSSQFAGRAAH